MNQNAQPPARLLRIKLSTSFPHWPLARQTPHGDGVWGGCHFFINQPVEACDAWFVYDGLTAPDQTSCPESSVIFVTAEPASFKRYDSSWLQQFAHVLSCQSQIQHRSLHQTQTGLPWFVPKDYATLKAETLPAKTKLLSAITSDKTTTLGHRTRLDFIRALQAAIPEMDVFGRGLKPLENKADGLLPYRYSVAIENSQFPDYWTEKAADCFLCGTVPLYHGCPNLANYFPPESFISIEIARDRWPETIGKIQSLLCEGEENYARHGAALDTAKQAVLNQHNLFAVLASFVERLNLESPRRIIRLAPEPTPSYWSRKLLKWRRVIQRTGITSCS